MFFCKIFWLIFICFSFNPSSKGEALNFSASDFMSLPKEERALIRDLKLLNYPPVDWRKEHRKSFDSIYDVAIIGGGMAGLTAGAALFKEGIFHIKVFDQNKEGEEGPWKTYARMKTLRSAKEIMGPALEIPHLTFHAWFEAIYGADEWKKLKKISNHLWMDYLRWYRKVMEIPVENECVLKDLIPKQDCFELTFEKGRESFTIQARKVILATGRAGFGGAYLPDFVQNLSSSLYAHTIQIIDFASLKDKRVGIVGVGASSFDAAAVALENGAESVDLIMRRDHLPMVNKFASLPYKGFHHGYYQLSDEKKWEFMQVAFDAGIPPPVEALERLQGYSNIHLLANTSILNVSQKGNEIHIETNRGVLVYDFLILGTGFHVDGSKQKEFAHIFDKIALWKHYLPGKIIKTCPKFGEFPYLGPSFEFLPKDPETAPYLKNIYCYNYGATLSHGLLSSDIPAISLGATRLAQGIAADFFLQESDRYLYDLKSDEESDFEEEEILYLKNLDPSSK